jgi:uncharacterized protein YkwD
MNAVLSRRAMRLDGRLRTYGITTMLGLASLTGAVQQCEPAPAPPVVQVADVQDSVAHAVNHHRALAGLAGLIVDARLTTAAQGHADDMARRQHMAHAGANGTDGGQRLDNAGYPWSTWGENVAAGQATPTDVLTAWLASPGHRANMLHGGVSHIGVAASTGSNGVVYWTMVVAAGG